MIVFRRDNLQAGKSIYGRFDEELVIDKATSVPPNYWARRSERTKYASATRNVDNVLSTPEAMAGYYGKSDAARRMIEEMRLYNRHLEEGKHRLASTILVSCEAAAWLKQQPRLRRGHPHASSSSSPPIPRCQSR